MSRFLLLLLFLIWMAWRPEEAVSGPGAGINLTLFVGMYALLIVMLGMWSRLLARRVGSTKFRKSLRYFNRVMFGAQLFVPVWFAVGVFFLGWGQTVSWFLRGMSDWPVQVPGAIIGTIPALLAWMGLWWSQYPADRALREQNALARFDQDLPIYTSPPFREYVRQSFRLQILFSAVPILMILLVHDALMVGLWNFNINIQGSAIEGLVTFCSAIAVFIIVPALLYRILGAHPLPPSALRDRMEAMCEMHRLRFRNILLWPTHNRIANALVMGVAPRFRYVLLSDLLLCEMSDEQIEAVFAHELGHVVHRHMIWYLVFMKVLILVLAVVALFLEAVQRNWLKLPSFIPMDLLMTLAGFGGFLLAFGFISRRFERQADVFAARTLQRNYAPPPDVKTSHVGPVGAGIFASALERVARINNMPLGSHRRWEGGPMQRLGWLVERFADLGNNWLHGSIATRMSALHHMSCDPARTFHFDRRMARLYVTLLVMLVVSGTLAWVIKLPI